MMQSPDPRQSSKETYTRDSRAQKTERNMHLLKRKTKSLHHKKTTVAERERPLFAYQNLLHE